MQLGSKHTNYFMSASKMFVPGKPHFMKIILTLPVLMLLEFSANVISSCLTTVDPECLWCHIKS